MSSDDRFEQNLNKPAGIVPTAGQVADKRPMIVPPRISPEELKQLRDQAARALKRTDDGIELLGCSGNAAGLLVPDTITPEDMTLLADTLFGFEENIQLYIGDMLAQSEKLAYGSYEVIAGHYRREPATLYKYKSICNAVSIILRRKLLAAYPEAKPLTMTHYEYVMTLPDDEQEKWLTVALSDGWSTRKLSVEVMKWRQAEFLNNNAVVSIPVISSDNPPLSEDEQVRELPRDLSYLEDKKIPKKLAGLWVVAEKQEYRTMTKERAADVRREIDDGIQWLSLLKSMLPK